jgi:hypothetical protein
MRGVRAIGAALVAAWAFAGPATAAVQSSPAPPVRAAPSQYVEAPLTGGGTSRSTGSPAPAPESSGPGSALEAASDAVGAGDRRVTILVAGMVVVTLALVASAGLGRGRREPVAERGRREDGRS